MSTHTHKWDLEEVPYETSDPAGGWYLHFDEESDPLYISKAHCTEANAAFIVRACNAHEELYEALKAILKCADDMANRIGWPDNGPLNNARAAIAKAEERS